MRVLVTGCNGYIGSHVCKILNERGHIIDGMDIDIHGEDKNDVSQYLHDFHNVDVLEVHKHQSLKTPIDLQWPRYDAVVHLGGLSVVPESMKRPADYYLTNVMGTLAICEMFDEAHILFASTSAAWEMASPYAKSKVAAEDIIKEKAMGYTIFRFFNVSGSDGVHKQIGPSTHLIRVAAEVACKKREWIDIYGTDYNTKDGTCIRDYVHVVDLANAICNAVDDGPSNTPYECLGSNEGYSVFDVVATMRKVTGKPIAEKICGRRDGDAEASVVDTLSEKITLTKSLEDMCMDQYNLERGKNK
jgi:UDP-glucose 4-epimerase